MGTPAKQAAHKQASMKEQALSRAWAWTHVIRRVVAGRTCAQSHTHTHTHTRTHTHTPSRRVLDPTAPQRTPWTALAHPQPWATHRHSPAPWATHHRRRCRSSRSARRSETRTRSLPSPASAGVDGSPHRWTPGAGTGVHRRTLGTSHCRWPRPHPPPHRCPGPRLGRGLGSRSRTRVWPASLHGEA
jgi:hypothetical protein